MKIPIKKTNRKVPVSRNVWLNIRDTEHYGLLCTYAPPGVRNWSPVVYDISKGLENPLYVGSDFMEAIRNPKITSTYPERIPGTKPSPLTRVKERFKR